MKGGEYVIGDVEAAWMQAMYCPGHREAPEQEFDMVQALSSNEGVISPKDTAMSIGSVTAEQVSKQGDYTVQVDVNGIFTASYNSEGEVASGPLPCREDRRQDPHGGGMPTAVVSHQGGGESDNNSGGTDNLRSRGNVCQDGVQGNVCHSGG